MTDEHKSPPKTVQEIGIHLGYMSETLRDIKESIADSPSRAEFDIVKLDVKELKEKNERDESKYVSRKEFAVVGTVLGLIITIVNFGINIFNNIKG